MKSQTEDTNPSPIWVPLSILIFILFLIIGLTESETSTPTPFPQVIPKDIPTLPPTLKPTLGPLPEDEPSWELHLLTGQAQQVNPTLTILACLREVPPLDPATTLSRELHDHYRTQIRLCIQSTPRPNPTGYYN